MKKVMFLIACCTILCSCGNNGSAVSDKDLKLHSETTKNSSEAMQTVEGTAQAEKDVENETEEMKKEVGTSSDNLSSVIASSTSSKTIEPNDDSESKEETTTEKKEEKEDKKSKDNKVKVAKVKESKKAEIAGDDKKSKDKTVKKDKTSKAEDTKVKTLEKPVKKAEVKEDKPVVKKEEVVKNIGNPGFSFKKGGSYIYINQPFTAYKALGKEDNFFSAPSCAFQGKTKIYEYKDYTVSVVEEPKKEGLVFSVLLTDESVITSEGVKIGDDVQKMKKVYGKPVDTTDASFVYRKGDVELIFIHEDDEITSIEYRSTILEKENE